MTNSPFARAGKWFEKKARQTAAFNCTGQFALSVKARGFFFFFTLPFKVPPLAFFVFFFLSRVSFGDV